MQELIHKQVSASVVGTLSVATEKAAEALAAELLQDPGFRAEMREMMRLAFRDTMATLRTHAPEPPPAQEIINEAHG